MLPFLKPQKQGTAITMKTINSSEPPKEEGEELAPLKACATDIIQAINSKDIDKLAKALKDAFDIMEAEPHMEGPHEESEE